MRWSTRAAVAAVSATVVATLIAVPSPASAVLIQAVNDAYIAGANATFLTPDGQGIYANDAGISSSTRFKLIRPVGHGGLGPDAVSGAFLYRPDDGYVGVDTFVYCLTDVSVPSKCLSTEATVTITVQSVVERIGGADRYQVSAGVVAAKFDTTHSGTVYIASGEVFPDALSASAAAGANADPVLLTTRDTLPAYTRDQLIRLHPTRIVLLGGTNTIGTAIETMLGTYSPNVIRIAGADRYAVAAAVSAATFSPGQPAVYVASGEVFADALSGSAAAGKVGAPVLLVSKGSVPDVVAAELGRLAPQRIVVLGGNNTISNSVLTTLGAVAPTRRIDGVDRYALSANTSFDSFDPAQTHTVYVASGEVFPDALSGSAAATGQSAPVLLVTKDSVPAAVLTELDRIRPARIVLLGGINTITRAVEDELHAHMAR